MLGLEDVINRHGSLREPHNPLNDDYEVLDDEQFAPHVGIAATDALINAKISGDQIAAAEARRLATQDVLTAAGFQDYQAEAFQLGENGPTEVVRKFVAEHGWERAQDNDDRRDAKRELDDAIRKYIKEIRLADPDEGEQRLTEFEAECNRYRVHQLLDTADRNGNISWALIALGVPPELAEYTPWGNHDVVARQRGTIKALSKQLPEEAFPSQPGELSPEATKMYLELIPRVQLTDEQRRQIEQVIRREFAQEPDGLTEDDYPEGYWLNGQQPPTAENTRQPRRLSKTQLQLLALVAIR